MTDSLSRHVITMVVRSHAVGDVVAFERGGVCKSAGAARPPRRGHDIDPRFLPSVCAVKERVFPSGEKAEHLVSFSSAGQPARICRPCRDGEESSPA